MLITHAHDDHISGLFDICNNDTTVITNYETSNYLKNKYNNNYYIIPYDDEIYYTYNQNYLCEYDFIKLIKKILNVLNSEEIILLKTFINDNKYISQCEVAKILNTSQQCISYKLNKIKKKLSYLLKKE